MPVESSCRATDMAATRLNKSVARAAGEATSTVKPELCTLGEALAETAPTSVARAFAARVGEGAGTLGERELDVLCGSTVEE